MCAAIDKVDRKKGLFLLHRLWLQRTMEDNVGATTSQQESPCHSQSKSLTKTDNSQLDNFPPLEVLLKWNLKMWKAHLICWRQPEGIRETRQKRESTGSLKKTAHIEKTMEQEVQELW